MNSKDVEFASGCAMMIRRSALETLGGFDPRFFIYEEDVEICLRYLKSGYTIKYVPKALIMHVCQGSLRKQGEEFLPLCHPQNPHLHFIMYHRTKNRLLNMAQHAKGLNALKFWSIYPIYLCKQLLIYTLYGKISVTKNVYRAIHDFIKERKKCSPTIYISAITSKKIKTKIK
jgi:GT2 family glycosyltransferase